MHLMSHELLLYLNIRKLAYSQQIIIQSRYEECILQDLRCILHIQCSKQLCLRMNNMCMYVRKKMYVCIRMNVGV